MPEAAQDYARPDPAVTPPGVRDPDNAAIFLRADATASGIRERLDAADPATLAGLAPVSPEALRNVKFAQCLPAPLTNRMLRARVADVRGAGLVLAEPIRSAAVSG